MQKERFSLEEWLRGPSRGVVTANGKKVRIVCTDTKNRYPIVGLIADSDGHEIVGTFSEDGRFHDGLSDERDLYFADKAGVRFDPEELKPFDRVLVREDESMRWFIDLFSCLKRTRYTTVRCLAAYWKMCVPYNDETAGLLGTAEDCPEFYKWWED